MEPDSDEDEDQPFTGKDAKMVVSEISAAIDEALKPLTKRTLKLETRMDKIESSISARMRRSMQWQIISDSLT